MSNIYTKTGDKGTTGLYGGSRVDKDSLNVDAYGTVDEAISSLGVAYTLTDSPEIKEYINHIQKRMFQAGAELASDARGMEMLKDKIGEADIKYLENIIDKSTEVNGLMREFVVPGVNPSSAALHVARTVVRRAERIITALAKQVPVREELRKYINRLSDACFAMARLEEARAKNQEIEELKDTVRQVVKTLGAMGKEEDSMDMSIETLKKMALADVLAFGKDLLKYRHFEDKQGQDGLDGMRHNLRVLKNSNLKDTRLIVCSMEGPYNYPDIDKLLTEPEFQDMNHKVVITAEPNYLARFTSTNQVISYQRRFMNAANGQS